MTIAGDHVPGIPFVEVVGKAAVGVPEQIGPTCVKVGVTLGVTVMLVTKGTAHWPAVGVNVYEPEVVLLKAGDHEPVTPLLDVVGKVMVFPSQTVGAGGKVGTVAATIFKIAEDFPVHKTGGLALF